MPSLLKPPEEVFATANEYNMPAAWDGQAIGYEWVDPSRANRIAAVLATPAPHDSEEATNGLRYRLLVPQTCAVGDFGRADDFQQVLIPRGSAGAGLRTSPAC